ncbi:MAG: 3-deoxy-D-manno-octulosonic acid transferase [Planctomycetota bacterium]|nr:MAG: 3-deoxy-D-manno-octulosonic acid transferase [Planctomycetota bacterium]
MPYLLNLCYLLLLALVSPWLVLQALRTGKYRSGWGEKILGRVPVRESDAPCVWLHAVSLGEVSLIASLVSEIERRHPDWDILISTTTLTGHALAKTRYAEHTVFYCPLDFTWAVRRAIERVRPSMLLLVELELWPNLIAAAQRQGAKVAVVNGRLSDRSFRGYQRAGRLARHVLSQVDLVTAQNRQYADRFVQLGAPAEAVHVVGSLKFDGAETNRANPATVRLRELAGFDPGDVVFLAGSTQEPEERLAIKAYRELSALHARLRLVIVPRHPERFEEVARLLAASDLVWERRSMWNDEGGNPLVRVLLVDRVGELAAWWGTAAIAYVGGSMGERQGQNMIEPAAYGAAVSFGPKTRNFRDVVAALLEADASVVVHDGEELTEFVRRCLFEPSFAEALGARARDVIASHLGATSRTVDLLDALAHTGSSPASPHRTAA